MTRLTRKEVKFVWDDKCEHSFQTLKKNFTTTHVLTLPDENEGFVMYSDVFKLRLSYVLMQHGTMVAYVFRQLKVHEQNYATRDLELAAVVYALKL